MENILSVKATKTSANSEEISRRKLNGDRIFKLTLQGLGIFIVSLLVLMVILLIQQSLPAIKEFGLSFIQSKIWNPHEDEMGGKAFLFGTLLTSLLSLAIALPVSVASSLFISDICPRRVRQIFKFLVETIAAIPSIVLGLWALFHMAPWVKNSLGPFLKSALGFTPFFAGSNFGIGFLTATLILAVMITPTICSVCNEVFATIGGHQKEAALALGATRMEMIIISILRPSWSGILGASALGLGRALGETMAVAMVIGNAPNISWSLFSPGATFASVMANEFAEAVSDLHLSALCYLALWLFAVSFTVNFIARKIVGRANK